MSIYIPSEEELKDSYAFDHCVNLGCERCDDVEEGYDLHIAEFNAWLAEHDREVSERVWSEAERQGRDNEKELFRQMALNGNGDEAQLVENPYRTEK